MTTTVAAIPEISAPCEERGSQVPVHVGDFVRWNGNALNGEAGVVVQVHSDGFVTVVSECGGNFMRSAHAIFAAEGATVSAEAKDGIIRALVHWGRAQ